LGEIITLSSTAGLYRRGQLPPGHHQPCLIHLSMSREEKTSFAYPSPDLDRQSRPKGSTTCQTRDTHQQPTVYTAMPAPCIFQTRSSGLGAQFRRGAAQ
jgi:hypothetical protein